MKKGRLVGLEAFRASKLAANIAVRIEFSGRKLAFTKKTYIVRLGNRVLMRLRPIYQEWREWDM